ncbi:MAG: methionine--tRNA ligase [Spirochaetales bacterium]|nr:methionine--tRNA ligase [Spirochaetales bacterium]
MSEKKKILITSALPYVNNIPHLGNIIGSVLSADVFAKYCRIAGYETMFVCGTDEYGTTTVTKAKQEGLSPREICDKYHKIHKEIYDWFHIDFDSFGRTSDSEQTQIVQAIFRRLYENGYITEELQTQPYCEKCQMFLPDRYIEGICPHCGYEMARGDQCENCGKLLDPSDLKNPHCSTCGSTPVFKETKHLFLDLEKLKPQLENWIAKESVNWSNNAVKVTQGWLEQGLKKRCITRDLSWGVPVPLEGFENKVFYVWFDAPIGYISITAHNCREWEKWWKDSENVKLYQFMGKDNIPFHTVLFPASLLGTGENWTKLSVLSSTEYLNYEDLKFSKSRGTGIFGDQAKDSGIESDLYRYYLMRIRPEKNDTQFFWNDFMEKANGEIIANYGNLVNRVLQFISKFFDAQVPDVKKGAGSVFEATNFDEKIQIILKDFETVELKKALIDILDLCSGGNKFFQDNEPWRLIKENKEKCAAVIGGLFGFVRDISILLYPYIPAAVEKYFKSINLTLDELKIQNIGNYEKCGGLRVNALEVLFKKLEKEQVEELRVRFSGKQEKDENNAAGFDKLALKVGKIIEIERHPKADKLYVEKVDMGNGEIRQIVSGLVPYFSEDELRGKNVVVAYNLKAAKLRGVMSEGMILAAENNAGTVEIVSPDCQPGEWVVTEGAVPNKEEITVDDFFSVPLEVKSFQAEYDGKVLIAGGKTVKLKKVADGKIC